MNSMKSTCIQVFAWQETNLRKGEAYKKQFVVGGKIEKHQDKNNIGIVAKILTITQLQTNQSEILNQEGVWSTEQREIKQLCFLPISTL